MDFIEQLSPSGGYTDILVVVDQLTKQALFIPTIRSLDATMLAELFIKHVRGPLSRRSLLKLVDSPGS